MNSITDNPLYQRQADPSPALAAAEFSLSYQQLAARVSALCKQLEAQGLNQQSVLVVVSNSPLHCALLLHCGLQLAVKVAVLNPHHPPAVLQQLSKQLGASHYFCEDAERELAGAPLSLDWQAQELPAKLPEKLNPEAVHDLVFTSGSSAQPKAIAHCWRNHWASAEGSQTKLPLNAEDCWQLSLPLFHIGGQAILWRCLLAGAAVQLANSAELDTLSPSVSHLSLVPTQLYRLLQSQSFNAEQLKLKHLLLGGAAIPQDLIKQALGRGFKVYSSYGSTEMSSQIASCAHHLGESKLELLPRRQAKLVDGQLYLAGPCLAKGQWLNGKLQSLGDQQGWFASGDMAQLKQEKDAAQLTILGRANRMFICAGENIQPQEIEQALLSLPEIKQAVVLGQSDEEYGQVPVAFVETEQPLEQPRLNQQLRQFLAPLKLPRAYYQLHNSSGLKTQLSELQALLNQGQALPANIDNQ